jgi:O-antigen/teichoic acid export membrane protein
MSGWGLVSWLAIAIYTFALTALVFRRLGPPVFGLWAVITSIRSLLVLLDGGLALGVTRDVVLSREDNEARDRVASAYRIYLAIGAAALAVGLAASGLPGLLLHLSGPSSDLSRAVTLIVVVDAAAALAASPLSATLRGLNRFDILAVASIVQSSLGLLAAWLLIDRWGLLGVAAGILVSRLLAAGFSLGFLSLTGFRPWRARGTPSALRAVIRFAAPLYVLSIAGQLALGTDIPIVGAFYGALAAASYGVGAAIPAAAAALLFTILDVAFPTLSGAKGAEYARLIRWMLTIGSALGALGFTTIALNSAALLKIWVGTAPTLAVTVTVIYCATRLLNVPSHVLAIGAIARGQHGVLVPVIVCEALANVGLSVLLAATYSPNGPALATLATLFVSNIIVVPLILRRRLELSLRQASSQVLLGFGGGLAASVIIWLITSHLPGPGYQLAAAFVGSLIAAAVIVSIGPRARIAAIRVVMVIRLGGWQVWLRQREEIAAARGLLIAERDAHPIVWQKSDAPLVTVRIATYNRGRLVADRAIASALEQTHKRIEVVVVGDHCDEATEKAVRAIRDPRVRFENLAERGRYPSNPTQRWMVAGSAPMNRGVDLAKGDWIAPLDDDDAFTPDHVETLLGACRGRGLEFAYGISETEVAPGKWERVGEWPLRNGGIIHASVLYWARITFLRHDLESWRLWEAGDWNLWRRMRDAGVRMGFVNAVVCRHYLYEPRAPAALER